MGITICQSAETEQLLPTDMTFIPCLAFLVRSLRSELGEQSNLLVKEILMKVMKSARSKKAVCRDHRFAEQFDWQKPFCVTLFLVAMLEIVCLFGEDPVTAATKWLFPTPVGVSRVQYYGRIWFAAVVAAQVLIGNGVVLLLFKAIPGHKVKFSEIVRSNVHRWSDLAAIVAYGLAGFAFLLAVQIAVGLLLPSQPKDPVDNLTEGVSGLALWLMRGNITALGPTMEELVFRGVMLNTLRASLLSYRTRWVRASATDIAIAISAALFALSHKQAIWQYPPEFFKYWGAGLALAWTYQRSGRLGAAILAHMLANGIASFHS